MENQFKNIEKKIPFRVNYLNVARNINRKTFIIIILSLIFQIFIHINTYIYYQSMIELKCDCAIYNNRMNYIYYYSIAKICLMILLIILFILKYNL